MPTLIMASFVESAVGPPVVPTPTLPAESIETLTLLPVKNSSESSSCPAADSALINVSPSTSFTPPRDPHALPAPYPSN